MVPKLVVILSHLLLFNGKIRECHTLDVIQSESRKVQELNGIWDFRVDNSSSRNEGFKNKWFMKLLKQTGNVIPMPVPASYNDITQDKSIRDFVGWAWYDRQFYSSFEPNNERVVLRIGSAHYNTIVWLNGVPITNHSGGHLPFEIEVNDQLNFNSLNHLTLAINNTLSPTTLPPGSIAFKTDTNLYPPGYFVQNLQMDFFNYAGIHRSVLLYTTPVAYISDITIITDIIGSTGVVNFTVSYSRSTLPVSFHVEVVDMDGKTVASTNTSYGIFKIPNAKLWWPYTMSMDDYAYLYTLKVVLKSVQNTDIYRQSFGIRTVKMQDHQIHINHKPFYCYGFGKHEDADIRGKGLDLPTVVKDFNLIRWVGANCFRTSHYPYAEEIMDMADKLGIVVIDESPGVGITKKSNMGPISLAHHKSVMKELIHRDKNRPSVIMWSVANEPASNLPEADFYFKSVIDYTRTLDSTRPVTFVIGGLTNVLTEKAAQYVDVVCINYYFGWYSDVGHTEVIQRHLNYLLTQWFDRFKKPIIITEYGADTIVGLHANPAYIFSEEYQVEFIKQYHKSFDKLRNEFLVGEMIWNFADFMTAQSIKRVGGNKKGIFTRQRQPKTAAFIIRDRYNHLTSQLQHFHNYSATNTHGYE
ncbi:beta-glucuronidase-like [Tubulanus polymorphus]|uniref:beta-glucuronidase-like n=1 Tax=Tubulanus polymorphus TaxID=672921 RepID=UPI003DA64441